jgi:hypothetical protein
VQTFAHVWLSKSDISSGAWCLFFGNDRVGIF